MDIVQPRPQRIMCEDKKTKEAKFVAMPHGKDPLFVSQKYLDQLKEKNSNILYFKIDEVFDDWKNVYQYFNKDYLSNLHYYCRYIFDQSFKLQSKDIDEMIDKLQDSILNKLDELREQLKYKLQEHQQYYKNHVEKYDEPYQKIKQEYEHLKRNLSTYKTDDLGSLKTLKQSLNAFVKKIIHTQDKDSFNTDYIVEKVNTLRLGQKHYINYKIWDTYQQMIERSIQVLEYSYIQNNAFNQTQIPNKGFIFQVFQRIKLDREFQQEPQKYQHVLTDKLVPLISCSNHDLLNSLYNNKDWLKNSAVIALIRTSTDQSIGFYYNAKRKNESLLFNLTKNLILPVKTGFELVMADNDQLKETLKFGQDLTIFNDFTKCTSILGEAFDLKGNEFIGDKTQYLANGQQFDIEYFELYRINDLELLTPPIPRFQPPILPK